MRNADFERHTADANQAVRPLTHAETLEILRRSPELLSHLAAILTTAIPHSRNVAPEPPAPTRNEPQSETSPSKFRLNEGKRLLSETETAAMIGVKPQTLAVWRSRRRHSDLRFIKIGNRIKYRQEDVERFLQSHEVSVPLL